MIRGAALFRGRRKWVAAVLVGLLTAAGWLVLRSPPEGPPEVVTVNVRPPPAPEPEREVRHRRPRGPRLVIPAIGVSARIVSLGLKPDRTLEVPTNFARVGWWSGGAAPGARGAAVLAGHIDSKSGPAVFYRLRELEPGDRVRFIRRDRSVVRFVVQRLETHPKADFPTAAVYGSTRRPTLRLITCGGPFNDATGHYFDNVIAFARRV